MNVIFSLFVSGCDCHIGMCLLARWRTAVFFYVMTPPSGANIIQLLIFFYRPFSRQESRSMAQMNNLSSPFWATAAQSTWGKVTYFFTYLHLDFVTYNIYKCIYNLCFTVFDAYMKLSGFEIEESIRRETSGSLRELLLAVGKKLNLLSGL